MQTRNRKRLIFALLLIFAVAISGCTDSNSIKSLNPTGADPESSINLPDRSLPDEEQAKFEPMINIIVDRNIVGPEAELDLRAEALDPAGGILELDWDADKGTIITNNGSRITWQAPANATTATISCTATDQNGKSKAASAQIEVLGSGIFRLTITAERSSILTGRIDADSLSPVVPVTGAKVELVKIGATSITNQAGAVEFAIDQTVTVATSTTVIVKYSDWEISYHASLQSQSGQIIDSLNFYPGYEDVTVAIGKGDSFSLKRGMVEVSAFEANAGQIKSVSEVSVNVGSYEGRIDDSYRAVLPGTGASETNLRLTRGGYQSIDGYAIPSTTDGITLIRARLSREGTVTQSEPIITSTRPFNRQQGFPVIGPFEIGFGQLMDISSIFDDISLNLSNKTTGSMITISGPAIEQYFDIEWSGTTKLKLHPKKPLQPESRYSLSISRWVARSADGRMLKSYSGMYGEFVTATDASPSIIGTTPHNGASDVGRSGPFSLRFDRSMDTRSLYQGLELEITSLDSGARVTISGKDLASHFAITWKDNNTLLEMVPYRMLRAQTSYLIRLNRCALKSESGKIAQDFKNLWGQFKTGDL